ncbi:TetR/AcrR family transcriptional regulator C-terminal domain-containing protein [Amycolatopsis sp. NPDC059021]|uniref:TetR/AcrR family transcriptional regulator C-terminal domain-containing protein n=1 Tax=Amycolatopsis sp. NPDC059021 TaxID=3346704 RepID=UPI0036718E23
MPPRRGRPPATEAKLRPDAIVAAALATLQAEGLDGLTMGRVAERLGVRTASLYWHVRNKEELLDLLVDAVTAAQDLSRHVDPDDWRASLVAIMRAMRQHMLGYRDSSRLFAGRFSTGPGQVRNIETILGVLRGAGLSTRDAAYMTFLLSTFLIGFVGGEQAPLSAAVSAGRSARSYLDDLGGELASLPAESFPHLVASAADLVAPDLDSRFEFALDRLLDGVEALRKDRGR